MDIEGLQKSLSEIGVEQKIYFEDENETITNENFIELREQRETHEKLRFSDDLTKTDRFKNIEANTREIPGTNGGVKVTIAPLRNPRGQGNKIGDRLRNHQTSMAEWEKEYRKHDPDYELTSFINVKFHYAAWLQDNLDGEPFDYTFARGNKPEEAYVGEGTLLYGLELGMMELYEGDQAYIICTPRYGYGPHGVPPCIPANSTIVFNIRIERVEDEFLKTFLKMDCHERRLVPLDFVLKQADCHMEEARKQFTKASNPEKVKRADGLETYRNSGKNDGNFSCARRTETIFKNIERMLNYVILKNKEEQDLRDLKLFDILRKRTLALRKSFPSDTRPTIDCGKNALKIYDSLPDEIKEKRIEKLNILRANIVKAMQRDCRNYFDQASIILDNFEDEVQREDQAANEDSNFIRKIDKEFRKTFQTLRTELDKANERCIEAVANEIDDGNDDYTPLASGQRPNGHKMLDGKSLNLAELSAKLDEDDLANGKPKGDSVTYYRQMVDSLIESTSTRPEDRYIIFSQSTTSSNEKRWVVCYAESRGLIATERKVDTGGTVYTNLCVYKSKDDIPEEE